MELYYCFVLCSSQPALNKRSRDIGHNCSMLVVGTQDNERLATTESELFVVHK